MEGRRFATLTADALTLHGTEWVEPYPTFNTGSAARPRRELFASCAGLQVGPAWARLTFSLKVTDLLLQNQLPPPVPQDALLTSIRLSRSPCYRNGCRAWVTADAVLCKVCGAWDLTGRP